MLIIKFNISLFYLSISIYLSIYHYVYLSSIYIIIYLSLCLSILHLYLFICPQEAGGGLEVDTEQEESGLELDNNSDDEFNQGGGDQPDQELDQSQHLGEVVEGVTTWCPSREFLKISSKRTRATKFVDFIFIFLLI